MAADKKIALELTLGLQDANKSLEELNKLVEKSRLELSKTGNKGSKEFKDLEKAVKKTETQMKKSNTTTKTLNGTTTKLNRNLKATSSTAKATAASGQSLNTTMSTMGGTAGVLAGAMNTLKASLTGVIASLKTLRGAMMATGIGALILAVVSLKEAFTSSEEGQNRFAKILGVLGALVGNVRDGLAKLGDGIISVFTSPLESLKKFGKLLVDNVVNRFIGIVELIPSLGKAVSLLFKGEFAEAGKTAADAVGKVVLGVESVTDKIDEATKATTKFIEEQKKEANQAAQVADMRAKADVIERNLLIERSKLESDIAKLRLKAKQENQFSAKERKEALLEAQRLEDTLLDKETKALELRKDAQVLENTFSRTDKENKTKEAQAIAAVNNQIARRANVARTLQRELNTIEAQQRAENSKASNAVKKEEKDKSKALEDIRKAEISGKEAERAEEIRAEKAKYDELIDKAKEYGKDITKLEEAKLNSVKEIQAKFDKEDADKLLEQQEKKIADLQYNKELEEDEFKLRREELIRREALLKEDKTLSEAQRTEIEAQFTAERDAIEAKSLEARIEATNKKAELATDVLRSLSALTTAFAKDDEASQRKAFKLNKAFSIGQAAISTATAVTNALTAGGNAAKLATGAQFVEAGIVAATGAAQIAAISRTQFKGSSSAVAPSPTIPSAIGGSVGITPRSLVSPTIETGIPTAKVIVTETDIRNVSRDIDGVYNRATIVE